MPDGQTLVRNSVCPLDCPDTCSLSVTVDGDRIAKITGNRANPITEGVICNKVARYYPDFVHGPNRLRKPLLRTGPRGGDGFAEISWDEALDRIYDGFSQAIARHGAESVAPFNYAGPHGMLAMGSMDFRFFHKLGASKLNRSPLCGGVKGEAHTSVYGAMPGTPFETGDAAELIIVWSNNVTVSNLHLVRTLNRAKAKGAKIVVIDPKRIKVAEQADLHLAIRPSTDIVLAFAIAREMQARGALDQAFIDQWAVGTDAFLEAASPWTIEKAADECGLEPKDIRQLVDWYIKADPALIAIGNGLERGQNGGNAIRAILALPVLGGKWGKVAGGAVSKLGNVFPKTMDKLQRPDLAPEGTRTISILDLPDAVLDPDLDPRIEALFIYNHNPIATLPNQRRVIEALSRDDLFIAGSEVQMTDSMRYADVILPACSHFEHDELFSAYGQTYLQRAEPVIPPVGEALPNTEIFRKLAARFGFDEPCFKATDFELMDESIDAGDPRYGLDVPPSALPAGEAFQMKPEEGGELIPFKTAFPTTPSGKAELASEATGSLRGFAVPTYRKLEQEFPLMLLTPSSSDRTNATFGGHQASSGVPTIEIHPDDAATRSIKDGDLVRVFNALGETDLKARVTDAIRPGTVLSEKGTWCATSQTGLTVNALMIDTRADLADGACYNDTSVEISLAEA